MKSIGLNRYEVIILIRSLVKAQTEKYSLTQLLDDFKKAVGKPMPKLGHETVEDFLKSISGTIKVFSENNNVYIELALNQAPLYIKSAYVKSAPSSEDEEDVILTLEKPNESDFLIDRVETRTVKFTRDILYENRLLRNMYKKKFRKFSRYTYSKPLPHLIVEEEEDEEDPEIQMYWAKRYSPVCYTCLTREERLITEPLIDNCISSITLYENSIPFINVTNYAKVGDEIDVYVPEVQNPHKFFLQFQQFRNELAMLMGSMQSFYAADGNKYAVKNYRFKKGQFCAALYSTNPDCSEWYRGMVLEFGNEMTSVLLVDYGTIVKLNNTDLKYLDKTFGQLPRQAFHGKLENVKPHDGKYWSIKGCKKFYSLVFEEEIVAKVVNIDSEHALTVNLYYGAKKDLNVEDTLIQERFASIARTGDHMESTALPQLVYESKKPKRILRPDDIGRTRKTRSAHTGKENV